MESEKLVSEKTDSVKFGINAKGQWSGELKVYNESIEGAYLKAIQVAAKMEELIDKKNNRSVSE